MRKFLLICSLSCLLTACASTPLPAPEEPMSSQTSESMMIPDNALKTASGYAYIFLKQGTGIKPAHTDAVKVHLRVVNVEGTLVDESDATLAIAHSTPFLEEILPVMELGAVVRVWGESQARIWEIEMISVDEAYRAPEDVAAPPQDALTLDGFEQVHWRMVEPGTGENAHTGQAVRLHASRWKTDGEILESNRAGRGMVVFLNDESKQLDPIHDAMIHQMNLGAHARIWIPGAMTGMTFDLVEDLWLDEFLPQLETPKNLAKPDDNLTEIEPDAAWIQFSTQTNAQKLAENDAVEVDMTCWNGSTGVLIDSTYLRENRDVMEIKPALGVWFKIMQQAAPGDEFMTWIKASALPEQVNMDLVCHVHVFDKV